MIILGKRGSGFGIYLCGESDRRSLTESVNCSPACSWPFHSTFITRSSALSDHFGVQHLGGFLTIFPEVSKVLFAHIFQSSRDVPARLLRNQECGMAGIVVYIAL